MKNLSYFLLGVATVVIVILFVLLFDMSRGDLNLDGRVDITDLSIFSDHWQGDK